MTPSPADPAPTAAIGAVRVAVVIPVYNHERYIEAAIASVLGQTRPPDRIVVVDDGSRDGSVAAAERALADAGSIPVEFRTQANRGTARTLNETIARLDEEVVGILNSDDLWMPDRLERLLPVLDASRPSIAFSGVEFFGDADQPDLETYPQWMAQAFDFGRCFPTVGFSLLLSNISTSTGNFLFTRDLHEAVGGFDEAMPICHDWQFLLDALRMTEPTFVPEALYRYRIHGANTYREHADPSGREMRLLQQSYIAWASEETQNPLAPTPRNFPRWMPFFVPIWLRRVAAGCHTVPTIAMRSAPRWRDAAEAVPAEIERESIAASLARIRAQGAVPEPPSLEEGRLAAAARWSSVRRRVPGSPRRSTRCAARAATFSWSGASTTVASHDPRVLRDLAELTGLAPMPAEIRLGRAELNALPECQVFVHDQLRSYRSEEDRLIWMALTVGEFLARHAACPLLHAASLGFDATAALLCGPPFAGKSTATLRAIARGLDVLGDDQVRVAEGRPLVQAMPRPVKLRVELDAPLPAGVQEADRPIRGMLETEETLMLRRAAAISPDQWLPVAAIFHLSREPLAGCRLSPIGTSAARPMLQSQLRGCAADDPQALDTTYSGLLGIPHFGLVVGDRRTDEALDLVERTMRELADRGRPVA